MRKSLRTHNRYLRVRVWCNMLGNNLCQNDTKKLKESLFVFNKALYIPIIIKKRLKCSIVFFSFFVDTYAHFKLDF